MLKIKLISGRQILCTENHPLMTVNSWLNAECLKLGDRVAVARKLPFPKEEELSVCRKKRYNYIKSTPEVTAENILAINFKAEQINEKWLTDVTEFKYVRSGQQAYLSAIFDLGDRSIVSYVIGHSNNQLVYDTFNLAIKAYPDAKPIFHSDRVFQYTSKIFKEKLNKAGMTQNMSRVGRCIDNGPMEGF